MATCVSITLIGSVGHLNVLAHATSIMVLCLHSVNDDAPKDMHPERRVKAAYAAFEEVNLPRLKAENPNLRLSQLKQMLKKDWMKSPENPLNQR